MNGILAGDRFQHRLELIPLDEPCARTRARARRGVVVVETPPVGASFSAFVLLINPSFKQSGKVSACLSGFEPARREVGYEVYGAPR